MKAILGFLNTKGGTVLVGVTDKKELVGLQDEINLLYKESSDKLKLQFHNAFKDKIGNAYLNLIDNQIVLLEEKPILIIECKSCTDGIFDKEHNLWIRTDPATKALKGKEASNYILARNPKN